MALLAAPFQGLRVFLCSLQLIQDIARLRRRSLRHSRQLDFPKPYIAARFRSLPSHFILGDMKHYDNFENRALEPGQKYVIFILAVLQEPEAVSAACCPRPSPILGDGHKPCCPPGILEGFFFPAVELLDVALVLGELLVLVPPFVSSEHRGHEQLCSPGLCGQNLYTCGSRLESRMGRNTELSPLDCTQVQRALGQIPFLKRNVL